MREALSVIIREALSVIIRETLNVILNECEGSVTVVGKTVRCHQSNRFFALCHVVFFPHSHTAFLPPFRMTRYGKASFKAPTKDLLQC